MAEPDAAATKDPGGMARRPLDSAAAIGYV